MEEALAPDAQRAEAHAGLIAVRDVPRQTVAQRLFDGVGWQFLRLTVDSALLIAATAWARFAAPDVLTDDGHSLVWLFPIAAVALLASRGMYTRATPTVLDTVGKLLAGTALAAVVLIAIAAFVAPSADPAPLLGRAWLFGGVLLVAGRLVLHQLRREGLAHGLIARPTLIVGAGVVGSHVERRLRDQPTLGLQPVGYLDADPAPIEMVEERIAPVLGPPAEIERAIRDTGAKHVVFSFLAGPDSELIPLVERAEAMGCQVSLVPRLFESVNVHFELEHLGGLPLFGIRSIDPKGWQFTVKHFFDRIGAATLILLLSPVLILLALAVRVASTGPILFRQVRVGRDGHEFEMLKFRSMRLEPTAAAAGQAGSGPVTLADDTAPGGVEGADRRTFVGTVMRSTSLDELPQLFNVLKGDMSLVGPRPERPEFVDVFGSRVQHYDRRHRVRSGITGWAQVNGLRGKTSLRDRVEWDNFYIENWSLKLDLKILLLTLKALFQRAE